jgi:hypothetical protein
MYSAVYNGILLWDPYPWVVIKFNLNDKNGHCRQNEMATIKGVSLVTFLPKGVCPRVLKFCMGFLVIYTMPIFIFYLYKLKK